MFQFPTAFEFNELLLQSLHEELVACRFGTFLFNCERERNEKSLPTRTRSFWEYISIRREDFINPFYDSKLVTPIFPNCEVKDLQIWDSFYFLHSHGTPPVATAMNSMQQQMIALQQELAEIKKKYKLS